MLAIPHLLLSRALPASFGHFQTTLPLFSFKAPNSMNFKGISEQFTLFYRVILSPSLPSFLGQSPPSIGYFSSCLIIFPSISALAIHGMISKVFWQGQTGRGPQGTRTHTCRRRSLSGWSKCSMGVL